MRRGPAKPGLLGAWFIRTLEPHVKPLARRKAPSDITPRCGLPLVNAVQRFPALHPDVDIVLRALADLDLSSILFPNPFVPGVRSSLATGFHVITAHERRHLWQARRTPRSADAATRSELPLTCLISNP